MLTALEPDQCGIISRDEACKVLAEAERLVGTERARFLAFAAITAAYPKIAPVRLGIQLGFKKPREARATVNRVKSLRWWDDGLVDELVGGLVAPLYGDRSL